MTPEMTLMMKLEGSVLGYHVGDVISLSEKDFTRLSNAFLREIEMKFT